MAIKGGAAELEEFLAECVFKKRDFDEIAKDKIETIEQLIYRLPQTRGSPAAVYCRFKGWKPDNWQDYHELVLLSPSSYGEFAEIERKVKGDAKVKKMVQTTGLLPDQRANLEAWIAWDKSMKGVEQLLADLMVAHKVYYLGLKARLESKRRGVASPWTDYLDKQSTKLEKFADPAGRELAARRKAILGGEPEKSVNMRFTELWKDRRDTELLAAAKAAVAGKRVLSLPPRQADSTFGEGELALLRSAERILPVRMQHNLVLGVPDLCLKPRPALLPNQKPSPAVLVKIAIVSQTDVTKTVGGGACVVKFHKPPKLGEELAAAMAEVSISSEPKKRSRPPGSEGAAVQDSKKNKEGRDE